MLERFWRARWAFAILVGFVPGAFAEQLSAPIHRATYAEAFREGAIIPKWSGGFLLSWRSDLSASDLTDNFIVYNRKGAVVARYRLWFPSAAVLWIRDAAASPDGKVAAVGNCMTGSGQTAGFVLQISLANSTVQVTQTSPFEGRRVVFGPDGTIWVLGYQLGEGRKSTNAPEHALVQHYGADGKLIGEHLPWSAFKCGSHPVLGGRFPHLAASNNRVGILLPACHAWVELGTQGELLGRWTWKDINAESSASGNWVWQIAMTPAGELYGRIGSGLFRLNREGSQWEPVELSPARGVVTPLTSLIGSEGDLLVYRTGSELLWASVSK